MKNTLPIAAILGVSAFVRSRIAAGHPRQAANGNGGAGLKTKTTSAAATNVSGPGIGEETIPTTGVAGGLRPRVRYKIPPQRYKIPLTCSKTPPERWRSSVFLSPP